MNKQAEWSENGVRVQSRGAVFEITLDRPKANAINTAVSASLARAFMEFGDTPDYRVALVTGGGERFFSAGWDLKSAAAGEAVTADHGPGGFAGLTELFDLEKPVIAVVNGLAVGGGFELALACDLIVAADHAEFFFPESGLGIIPDSGGVLRLPQKLPQAIALELLYTGRRMPAAEAKQLGLVNRVVPMAALMDSARSMAQDLAAKAPLAIAAIKHITTATAHLDFRQGYRVLRSGAIPAYQKMLNSEDAKEGIAAYGEGRQARWRGA